MKAARHEQLSTEGQLRKQRSTIHHCSDHNLFLNRVDVGIATCCPSQMMVGTPTTPVPESYVASTSFNRVSLSRVQPAPRLPLHYCTNSNITSATSNWASKVSKPTNAKVATNAAR
ncbi:uncharacterized protein LOC144141810 [Haemaphysalis longicornis]